MEYFSKIDPYTFISADFSFEQQGGGEYDLHPDLQWMDYSHGAKPIFNAAVGFRMEVKENVRILGGFRTDFNYRRNMAMLKDPSLNIPRGLDLNVYHLTGGLSVRVFGQDIIAGLQYSISRENNREQFINIADPVEYNVNERAPLQGDRLSNVSAHYNSFSVYLGATFNFGGGKKERAKEDN
jgi:hypothetical protein